jgi:hypothetical protein
VSLAWSTIALLVLLLPGFLFFVGLYFPERISRDVVPGSSLTQLGGVVLIAFFLHGLLYAILASLCQVWSALPCVRLDYALAAFNPDLGTETLLREIAANIERFRWWILAYLAATSALGLLGGIKAGKMIVDGRLRFLAKHDWIYDLVDPDDSSYTVAYVVTNIRADDRVLMYRGFLQEYCFTAEGKVSYLVLVHAARYYLKLEERRPRTSSARNWLSVVKERAIADGGAPEREWSYMVLEGQNIANVVFDRYHLNLADNESD